MGRIGKYEISKYKDQTIFKELPALIHSWVCNIKNMTQKCNI